MLERSTPELEGISSKSIINFLEGIEANYLEIHNFMIIRNGKVIAEGGFKPYKKELHHTLYSLSKSFTSTAIGFLCEEGLLSVENRLVDLFPEDVPVHASEYLKQIRIKDLLTMNTGHVEDTLPYQFNEENPVKAFFNVPVIKQPSTHFMYHNGATYLLSYIIKKRTNLNLVDYLMPRLFEPLGIERPYWEISPHGINNGAYGLYLKIEDIAKFGLLYLNKGIYNGKRIISEDWIQIATAKQVSNDSSGGSEDWIQGYGYQFWRCRHNAYRGDGAFGQYCVVIPDANALVVMNSGIENLHVPLNLIWEHLLPNFHTNKLEPNDLDHQKLKEKIAQLKHLPNKVKNSTEISDFVNHKIYVFSQNEFQLEIIAFDFEKNKLKINDSRGEYTFNFGLGEWMDSDNDFYTFKNVFSSGTWVDDQTFLIEVKVIETPFTYYWKFTFINNEVKLDYSSNLGFYRSKEIASISGKIMV